MLEALVEVLLTVACAGTGHVVLYVLTLGHWSWSSGRDDLATVVGILFWIVFAVLVWLIFFR